MIKYLGDTGNIYTQRIEIYILTKIQNTQHFFPCIDFRCFLIFIL